MKPLFLSLIMTLIVLVSGCSTLRTNVRSDVDWSTYSSVAVSVPEPDRWEMRPLVIERLTDWGFVPVVGNQQHSDLLAILEVTEGSSLAENGDITTWPKNLLLRLHDRSNGAELARSRYQLAPTQSPKHGLSLMVNDLRKQTGKTTDAAAQAPQPQENKTATIPAASPAPQDTSVEASSIPAPAPTPPASTSLNEPSEPEATKSEWTPRFKGWQPWGEDNAIEEHY